MRIVCAGKDTGRVELILAQCTVHKGEPSQYRHFSSEQSSMLKTNYKERKLICNKYDVPLLVYLLLVKDTDN